MDPLCTCCACPPAGPAAAPRAAAGSAPPPPPPRASPPAGLQGAGPCVVALAVKRVPRPTTCCRRRGRNTQATEEGSVSIWRAKGEGIGHDAGSRHGSPQRPALAFGPGWSLTWGGRVSGAPWMALSPASPAARTKPPSVIRNASSRVCMREDTALRTALASACWSSDSARHRNWELRRTSGMIHVELPTTSPACAHAAATSAGAQHLFVCWHWQPVDMCPNMHEHPAAACMPKAAASQRSGTLRPRQADVLVSWCVPQPPATEVVGNPVAAMSGESHLIAARQRDLQRTRPSTPPRSWCR